MPYDSEKHTGRLKRLDASFYQGHSWVHWTITIEDRKSGWLNNAHHAELRELLLHAFARQNLICPVYCLMPDHAHFLLGGLSKDSDQRIAMRFLRSQWNRILAPQFSLQSQAYDHVLTTKEAERKEFQTIAGYLLENPVRAKLANRFIDWPFSGCVAAGYPDLYPSDDDFWERFWKIYHRLTSD